ncbi:hypothetical protein RKD47_005327 [Streptomyces albogriseolus]
MRPAIQPAESPEAHRAADDDHHVGVAPGVVGGLVGGDDGDLLAVGAEFLADDEGAVDALHQQAEFGGSGAGRGENRHFGVGPAHVHGAAQGARVGDDHLRVVPGHAGPGEGGGDRGDGGHDLDLQAELRCAQGAYDAEEAGVAVGEHDRGAAVRGDAAGGEGDGAEADALGRGGHLGERQVVCGTGDQRGGAERAACRVGQRRAVPADHRDPVGHRRQSPEVCAGRRRLFRPKAVC